MMVGMRMNSEFQPSPMNYVSWLGEHIPQDIDVTGYSHDKV